MLSPTLALPALVSIFFLNPLNLLRVLNPVRFARLSPPDAQDAIPPRTTCDPAFWCDSGAVCSRVCAQGSVQVDPWLAWAARWQATHQSATAGVCEMQLLGSHNSAITTAAGFGNRDLIWSAALPRSLPAERRRVLTASQRLSIFDQLSLGVRAIEIDVHAFGPTGPLRVAHCGGLDGPIAWPLNGGAFLLKWVLRTLHVGVDWGWRAREIGCEPGFSSVPTREQQHAASAVAEVGRWLQANKDQLVVLFFDDDGDLDSHGRLVEMENILDQTIGLSKVVSREDVHRWTNGTFTAWPTGARIISEGKSVIVYKGWGARDRPPSEYILSRREMCALQEPKLQQFKPYPLCTCGHGGPCGGAAQWTRLHSCEVQYGPWNCGFHLRSVQETPLLDEESIPQALACGVSVVSPDFITPERAAAGIWSWAPGHPGQGVAAGELCAAASAQDGRWRTIACSMVLPAACQSVDPTPSDGGWAVSGLSGSQEEAVRSCPQGFRAAVPRTPRENALLRECLRESDAAAAWLPLTGASNWS